MSATAAIRPMQADDAAGVAALCGQLGYPTTASQVQARFARLGAREDSRVFVAATDDGAVLGWVHVYAEYLLESDVGAEIGGLVVSDSARGRGVGRELMSAAEDWARTHGCAFVRVRSNVVRTGAHAFYERLGYAHFKTQKNFRKDL